MSVRVGRRWRDELMDRQKIARKWVDELVDEWMGVEDGQMNRRWVS